MKNNFQLSKIPNEGLCFFHGLSNWVEEFKKNKTQLISWRKANNALSRIKCIKFQKENRLGLPKEILCDTLYVPSFSSCHYVLCQLRNAFCHNDLQYNKNDGQYSIEFTDKVKISGRFSLKAIEELVTVFLI